MLDIYTTYHGVPADVRAARHLVALRLAGVVPVGTCELAVLLTSEIVTNAIIHTDNSFALRLMARADAIRVEVHDGDPRAPLPRPRTLEQEHGRGLYLVASLASRWGWEPNGAGKSVWFELDRVDVSNQWDTRFTKVPSLLSRHKTAKYGQVGEFCA